MSNPNASLETDTHVANSLAYRVALGCYVGLIALLLLWYLWLAPPPPALRTPMLLIMLLPLLLGLRGVLHRRRYTLQWTGMLSLLYFVYGIMAATGPETTAWLGSLEMILALTYLCATMLLLRRGKKAHKAAKTPPSPNEPAPHE